MDALIDFFVQWGYLGLFLGSFLAGSIVPLSSEALLVVCIGPPLHLNAWICFGAALTGNVLGGITCYWIGHLGNLQWIKKYTHVKEEQLAKAERWVQNGWGAWMSLFSFVPFMGDVLIVALGYLRSNFAITVTGMTTGKALRYASVIWGTNFILNLL